MAWDPRVDGAQFLEFFQRLASLDQVLRIIVSGARLRVRFTVRGEPERSVLLDFSAHPVCAREAPDSEAADVVVAMSKRAWHEVLSGALAPGEALGRREMLLRGSASDLARCIPLFDFAPMLYGEHWEQRGVVGAKEEAMRAGLWGRISNTGLEKRAFRTVGRAAYSLGYCMGIARYRVAPNLSLFELLQAMSRGLHDARNASDESERRQG
jgi:hypothetical protein